MRKARNIFCLVLLLLTFSSCCETVVYYGQKVRINEDDLYLASRAIEDVSDITMFKNLKRLNLDNNWIKDISPVFSCTELQYLRLESNRIDNITGIDKLNNLEVLCMSNNSIVDISQLSSLRRLKALNISDNKINDISALSNLSNLTALYMIRNPIEDHSPLKPLKNLEALSIDGSGDLSCVSNSKNLKQLCIGENVSDISAVSNFKNLERLELSSATVTNYSGVSSLKNLKYLILKNTTYSEELKNQIMGLENLEEITITCAGMEVFELPPSVKKLKLIDFPPGDDSQFAKLVHLEKLEFEFSEEVSRWRVPNIREIMPWCYVYGG